MLVKRKKNLGADAMKACIWYLSCVFQEENAALSRPVLSTKTRTIYPRFLGSQSNVGYMQLFTFRLNLFMLLKDTFKMYCLLLTGITNYTHTAEDGFYYVTKKYCTLCCFLWAPETNTTIHNVTQRIYLCSQSALVRGTE